MTLISFAQATTLCPKPLGRSRLYGFAGLLLFTWLVGCGSQNEYLVEGKDFLKSDKRRKVELAVEQFRLALENELSEREKAETHYLLGYYDPNLTPEQRAEHFVTACELAPKKYEEALIYETLRDQDEGVRQGVRLALAERYAADKTRIHRELVKALRGKDNRDRYDAAWVLGYLAARNEGVTDDIIAALRHKRMETRLNAVQAVGELASHSPERAKLAVPALLEIVEAKPRRVWWKFWDAEGERESPEVRVAAVTALGKLDATESLLAILANKGSSLRSDALQSLIGSGGSDEAIGVLLALLEGDAAEAATWETPASLGKKVVQIK